MITKIKRGLYAKMIYYSETSYEINAPLQNFTQTTKTKLIKGHYLAKSLRMITNIELDLYFTMVYPSANFQ